MCSAFDELYKDDSGSVNIVDFDVPGTPVSPPLSLLVVGSVEMVVCAVMFALGNVGGHVVGYAIGAVLLPITVAAYRQIDRRRGRSGRYAAPSGVHLIPTPLLVIGVALAMTHAFYLAINKRLA